jgi:LysR family transcriptional regulator, cyn operon transcriptional activator
MIAMNLRALRMFVTTADSGGLGRACAQLNLSQPAASRQIHALEAELGVLLFHRVGRQLQLTTAGEDLILQSRRLLADADLLADRARELKGGRRGTLKVGASPQTMTSFLASFLPRYRRRHSGIEVQLIERSAGQQSNELERGEADLAIMPANNARFPGRLLFPIYVFAVVPNVHRLARLAVVDITELMDDPLLLVSKGFGTRSYFDAACEMAQVTPHIRFECSASHTLIGLAAVNYGVAIVPSIALVADENVRAVPIVVRDAALGHWEAVYWDPRRHALPYLQAFVHELEAYASKTVPGRNIARRVPPLPKPGRSFK